MATSAEINAQLDSLLTGKGPTIIKSEKIDATYTANYVIGGVGYAGRDRWVKTTTAQTAAQQATEITTALAA